MRLPLAHMRSLPKITELSSRFLGKDTPAQSPELKFFSPPLGRGVLSGKHVGVCHLT